MTVQILIGDVREQLRLIPSNSIDCCVTSPPYWGLRKYIEEGQPEEKFEIGLEPTLGEHLAVMVEVFREVRRVLKAQGTCWVNYGDCYAAAPNGKSAAAYKADGTDDRTFRDKPFSTVGPIYGLYDPGYERTKRANGANFGSTSAAHGGRIVPAGLLKPKDLCMIPNRLAIALQDDGWYVRSEIIWHKPNPMPESVYDRPTTAHEKIWLLTKSESYFYNHAAIAEECVSGPSDLKKMREQLPRIGGKHLTSRDRMLAASGLTKVGQKRSVGNGETRNARNVWRADDGALRALLESDLTTEEKIAALRGEVDVWTIAPKPFREAHFATFPPELAQRCISAGCPVTVCGYCGAPDGCGGICQTFDRVPGRVLDPFGGSGTVGMVAQQLGVDATLIELNPGYSEMIERRCGLHVAESTEEALPSAA